MLKFAQTQQLWSILQSEISFLNVFLHMFTDPQISSNTVASAYRASYELVADIAVIHRATLCLHLLL